MRDGPLAVRRLGGLLLAVVAAFAVVTFGTWQGTAIAVPLGFLITGLVVAGAAQLLIQRFERGSTKSDEEREGRGG